MKNDQERTELLQQIDKLLTAVDSMQTCLEAPEATNADGSFDIARTNLRITANVIFRRRLHQLTGFDGCCAGGS